MPGKPRFTASQVIAALQATHGMVYLAAKRLKCDPDTVLNYCKRYPSVEAVKQSQRGQMIDLAEQKLWESIQKGEAWGITLCLKTIGKDRGYVERQEVTGNDGAPLWEPTSGLAALLEAARHASAATNGHALPSLRDET
jgi:hypothetical protein